MKILLFGKNGQLGWELQRSLAPLGEVIALGTQDTPCADFTRPADVAATVRQIAPDVIVNAAAYTAVDAAESDTQAALAVNATTPGLLAQAARELNIWLLHYSTDYVFDGQGTEPWREDDPVGPLNEYGRGKLAGEDAIRASGCRYLNFRTSWLYAARGGNFAKTMLRLAQQHDTLKVINDQHGAPTGADLLADISAHALRMALQAPELAGTYHVAAGGVTTWHGYAQHVINHARAAGLPIKTAENAVQAVPTHAFPTPARRPSNSRLDTSKLQAAFGLCLPPWQVGVDRMLAEIIQP